MQIIDDFDQDNKKDFAVSPQAEFAQVLLKNLIEDTPKLYKESLRLVIGKCELYQLLIEKRECGPYLFALFSDGSLLSIKRGDGILMLSTNAGYTKSTLDSLISTIKKSQEKQ